MDNLSWFFVMLTIFVIVMGYIVKNDKLGNKIKSSKGLMYYMLFGVMSLGVTLKYLEVNHWISEMEPVGWTLSILSAVVILLGIVVKKYVD